MNQTKRPGIAFLDLTFDDLSQAELVADLLDHADAGSRFAYVVTPNVDHMVRRARDPQRWAPLYEGASWRVCDSRILELLARLSGLALPIVPGSDLTAHLFTHVIAPDEPVVVIGADAQIEAALAARFGLTRLKRHSPPMGLATNPAAIAQAAQFVADHPARFVFLCVGSPQQEMVAQAIAARGDCVGVGLCVGASLDFLAGRTRRAPVWLQRLRLEWLFRLLSEPGRLWRRYLVEGPAIFAIWWHWDRQRRKA